MIELLVCLAVIGILAAILLPAVGAVRSKAREARCSSNLRQIGTAFHLYGNEHDKTLPPKTTGGGAWEAGDWYPQLLAPYMNAPDVWWCPAASPDRRYGHQGKQWITKHTWKIPTYSINANLAGKRLVYAMDGAPRGGDQVLLADGNDSFWDQSSINDVEQGYVSTRHDGHANVLFVNGAVGSARRDDFLVSSNPYRTWDSGLHLPQRVVKVKPTGR